MRRRKFSREFKLEAVRLVKDRGVAVAQAARDLDLHENVLRKWIREAISDPQHAFPGHGQVKPDASRYGRRQLLLYGFVTAPPGDGILAQPLVFKERTRSHRRILAWPAAYTG